MKPDDNLTVMILDDDILVRTALADMLSARYHVVQARNYSEFKSLMADDQPHILFLDLNLPDAYGVDICRSLRRSTRYDDMVIIILTGSNSQDVIEDGYSAGADEFIRKPFVAAEITAKMSIFERIIRGKMNLESAFRDQLTYNRKLYKLEEIIKKSLSAKGFDYDHQAIEMLHEIIPFAFYEVVMIGDDGIEVVATRQFEPGRFLDMSSLGARGLLDREVDIKGKSFRVKKGGVDIHALLFPLMQAGRAAGYALLESHIPFKADDVRITGLYLDYVGIMIERAATNAMLNMKNREYKTELSMIRKIQVSLLPGFANITGYDIAASYLPAKEISGDFFDGFFIDEKVYQLILCDISGHGMASAYVGAQIRALFRSVSEGGHDPAWIAAKVSEAMLGDLRDMAYFGTVFICRIYLEEGRIVYLNGGHPAALYFTPDGRLVKLEQTGPLLGLFPGNEYQCREFFIEEGGSLLLYTDGIIEASAASKDGPFEMYGEERLVAAFELAQGMSARDIIHSIVGTVYEFTDYNEQEDDITAICIRKDSSVGGIIMF